jgi:hypothetical protein
VLELLGAVGGDFSKPIDHLGIAASIMDQASNTIAACAFALVANDPQRTKLAGEITENDGAIGGHIQRDRWPNRYIKPTATTAPIIAKSAGSDPLISLFCQVMFLADYQNEGLPRGAAALGTMPPAMAHGDGGWVG